MEKDIGRNITVRANRGVAAAGLERRRRRARKRVSAQEGSPPPLAYTEAEVGFFIWIYTYRHERAGTRAHTCTHTYDEKVNDGARG